MNYKLNNITKALYFKYYANDTELIDAVLNESIEYEEVDIEPELTLYFDGDVEYLNEPMVVLSEIIWAGVASERNHYLVKKDDFDKYFEETIEENMKSKFNDLIKTLNEEYEDDEVVDTDALSDDMYNNQNNIDKFASALKQIEKEEEPFRKYPVIQVTTTTCKNVDMKDKEDSSITYLVKELKGTKAKLEIEAKTLETDLKDGENKEFKNDQHVKEIDLTKGVLLHVGGNKWTFACQSDAATPIMKDRIEPIAKGEIVKEPKVDSPEDTIKDAMKSKIENIPSIKIAKTSSVKKPADTLKGVKIVKEGESKVDPERVIEAIKDLKHDTGDDKKKQFYGILLSRIVNKPGDLSIADIKEALKAEDLELIKTLGTNVDKELSYIFDNI